MPYFVLLITSLIVATRAVAPPPLLDVHIGPLRNIQVRTSFRSIYVTHDGNVHRMKPSQPSINVDATNMVPDLALTKAGDIISHMVKHMPSEVFSGLTRSHGVGLFSVSEGPTIYPENKKLADRPECRGRCDGNCAITCTFDGRKWQTIAGLTNSRSVVIDDNVLCNSRDPYRRSENILSHEFGHLVMAYMPATWKSKIISAYNNARSRRLWKLGTYAMANAYEYWAEATEAFFFDTTRTDVTGGMNMCGTSSVCPDEFSARAYIKRHDPGLYQVLIYAYMNNMEHIHGGLRNCQ